MRAHNDRTGRFVLGEVKLALVLHMLAGGSYLDLCLLYEVRMSYSHQVFHAVIQGWILDDRLVKINGIDYIQDWVRLEKVAVQFAKSSGGLLNGSIGAIDGWIVRIKNPSNRDNIPNPGSFYSRKGFLD